MSSYHLYVLDAPRITIEFSMQQRSPSPENLTAPVGTQTHSPNQIYQAIDDDHIKELLSLSSSWCPDVKLLLHDTLVVQLYDVIFSATDFLDRFLLSCRDKCMLIFSLVHDRGITVVIRLLNQYLTMFIRFHIFIVVTFIILFSICFVYVYFSIYKRFFSTVL